MPYAVKIIYDTGDSFHRETGVEHILDLTFTDLEKAKQALKDIEAHYTFYLKMHEYDMSKRQKDRVHRGARKQPWFASDEYPFYSVLLENDAGLRVEERTCWCGYFETLVGGDIFSTAEEGLSFRV